MSGFPRAFPQQTLSDEQFQRLGGKHTPMEAERLCPSCGKRVPPIAFTNGWIPSRCHCERDQYLQSSQRKERMGQSRDTRKASCAKCYTWLGENLETLRTKTFDNYQTEIFPEVSAQLLQFSRWQDPNTIPWMNFILFGNCGTGKTHLLVAVLNSLCNQDIPCRFMTGQGLFDAISASFGGQRDHTAFLQEAGSIPVLGIDDIDKIYIPERLRTSEENFQIKTLFNIINKRYVRHLPTLITTNSPDITQYVGEAGFSRLKEHGHLLPMMGDDFRDRMFHL